MDVNDLGVYVGKILRIGPSGGQILDQKPRPGGRGFLVPCKCIPSHPRIENVMSRKLWFFNFALVLNPER